MRFTSLLPSATATLVAGLPLVLASALSHAQATCELPLSAYLTDGAGTALAGAVDLTLTFYDGAGGDAVAMDCREVSVVAEDGWIRTSLDACGLPAAGACGVLTLREVLEAGLADAGDVYVGVEVGGSGVELSPRIQIGAAPFALFAASAEQAASADSLAGFDPTTPLADVSCAEGEMLIRTADAWDCGPPPTPGSTVESIGPATVEPGSTLELVGPGSPRALAQAWQVETDVVSPLVFADAPYQCAECGDGSDGVFEVPPLTPTATIAGGEYNFTSFEVPFGTTLEVTGNEPLIIRATDFVLIQGTVDLDADGSVGGPGGDSSSSGSGFGGGGGNRRTDFLPEHLFDVTGLRGGGAGTKLDAIVPSDIGGGGGGALAIVSPRVLIRGTVSADGGDGASGGTRGGGGAGGSVWLRGTIVEITGTISLEGGEGVGDGLDGLTRTDPRERVGFEAHEYNSGTVADLPHPVHVWQSPDGTIQLRSNASESVEVILSGE